MSAIGCPHGRRWEECIRCDPWCPKGLAESEYDRLQTLHDEASNARVREALAPLSAAAPPSTSEKDPR